MSSLDTSTRSRFFDMEQVMLALRDMVETAPASTDPWFVSALQQAKMVLRKHGVVLRKHGVVLADPRQRQKHGPPADDEPRGRRQTKAPSQGQGSGSLPS